VETDAGLTDSLMDVLACLRTRGADDSTVPAATGAFAELLADHLRVTEVLLPALRDMLPAAADDIGSIEAEHGALRAHARDLTAAIAGLEPSPAGKARWLLARMLSHVDRESAVVGALVHALDESDRLLLAGMCPDRFDPSVDIGGEGG
jgi:hypothetical protein